nr:multiple epidermal growth factor-like domains protein 9 [Oncorhynchus nerka]
MDSTTLSASACPATAAGTPTPGPHPRICNSESAHCLSCVYSTTGKHCEHCAEGYVPSSRVAKSPIPSTSSSAPGTSTNPAAADDDLDTSFSRKEPVDPLDKSFQAGTSSNSTSLDSETS